MNGRSGPKPAVRRWRGAFITLLTAPRGAKISPGDIGQAIAMRLKECGFEVLAALDTARTAAATIATINSTADKPIYADCNAVSPQTKLEMESMIRAAGGRFIDIGIIGRAAPRGAESPEAARAEKRSGKAVVSALAESRMPAIRIQGII